MCGPEGVVHSHNARGTAEQWIKEGKYALNWTLAILPSVRGQPGEAPTGHPFEMLRAGPAYHLGNFLRRLCLPKAVRRWSLRSVQIKLIKIGARLARHARRLVFRSAGGGLKRIGGLHLAPGWRAYLGSSGGDECSQGGGVCRRCWEGVQTW